MRRYVYGDESGNFDFSNGPGASRYFILTTVVVSDHVIEADLMDLRRQLAWSGESLAGGFHATNDKQRVRDRVFAVMSQHDFRVDATILEKRKADPRIRPTPAFFYGFAWYYHLTGLAPVLASYADEIMVVSASIGTNEMRSDFESAANAIASAIAPTVNMRATMWQAASNPILQVADYCAWAIRRKWERDDIRSYSLIENRIESEFDVFRSGTTAYY